ncbi:S-methyl-5-thioribose-1-phosphate isomerase [Methylocella silvestris]|uniref:Methylthioribose-1-phosphate isomerase n=1 Tax=Methylocella silvestris TaxID=199596 RepID=A0A2J7TMM3_METSI|nr:S-methyl-5-thioribose-1-phosphate isomerase [Methylocella silvestris]PNG28010.1 S-methyl-5-thioribose-1-phosphate isomerase [Methylocella silvestris]
MRVDGKPYTTIWAGDDGASIKIIDQTRLPHRFEIITISDVDTAARAIAEMWVRGAPLIGVTAAYGLALAMRADPADANLERASAHLKAMRPTAVNLQWAVDRVRRLLEAAPPPQRFKTAFAEAGVIARDDIALCEAIGMHGLSLIKTLVAGKPPGAPVNILTHCNAGWLATVDWGTATAPVYKAHDAGLAVHVYVDETRPRNQGAALTAFELGQHGVPHTVIADNAGGHLMQHGGIDAVIVGTDRTTASGDVCNKIGTYLKALAAKDNGVPFYVAAPSPSIDFSIADGVREVPIEIRSEAEVTHISGLTADGEVTRVRLTPEGSRALNPAFDVTPARLVTGLITERGVIEANASALAAAFREGIAG